MILIQDNDINKIIIVLCNRLLATGVDRCARGLKTIELDDLVTITLTSPSSSIVTLSPRRTNSKSYYYLEREFNWYLSGDLNSSSISSGSKYWKMISNTNGTINSNYGFIALVEKWHGISQFDWCIKQLINDCSTRQAVINYSQPRDKYCNNKDFICTLNQQFIVRNNQLDSIVWMRANDLVTGFCNDIPWFTYLQRKMALAVNIPIGSYTHIVTSLHAYEKDFEMVKLLSKIAISSDITNQANYIWKSWNDFTDGKNTSFYSALISAGII